MYLWHIPFICVIIIHFNAFNSHSILVTKMAMERITIRQALEREDKFRFTTRAEIMNITANQSYAKCPCCWKKLDAQFRCPKCGSNYKNRDKSFSLLLKVSFSTFYHFTKNSNKFYFAADRFAAIGRRTAHCRGFSRQCQKNFESGRKRMSSFAFKSGIWK